MDPLATARRLLRGARSVTAMTGAGVSAASGIPTFRGPGGLWKQFRPEELATPEAFARDPALVWEWYDWRRQLVAKARPNPAHEVLARWTRLGSRFTLITQNVDGLQERAGADPIVRLITQNVDGLQERAGADPIVRLHGSIWHVRCADGCGAGEWRDDRVPLAPLPPRCPACGGLARPAVVWFGEMLPGDAVDRAEAATRCDVFLTIGTSSLVYPAAGFARRAKANGAAVIEINPDETGAAFVDVAIRRPAEQALPALQDVLVGE